MNTAAAPQVSPLVLITGASRGIGAATARLAAAQGWDVAINYARDENAAEAVADAVRAAGRRALTLCADVADEGQVRAMFATLDRRLQEDGSRLAGLVNNAGVVDVAARVDEMSGARLQRMFAVNVFGTMLCAREAVRRMSTRHGGQGGSIVNLSSTAARLGAPGQYVDYAAAKGAVDVFTLGLAREVAAEGVRVNAVRPGVIDTEIHASGGQPERALRLAPTLPMQRPGRADEVAQAVVWLLSEAASYTSGAVLDVGGAR
ncbi:sugar dehydrogenase [beta proteobacterium AAP121]|nr:sugar dehydrogenase [beta proteobacterium AAP65]KPF95954.1 sugar dehydrogenase [beta proteobacterium AAP121]